MSRWSRFFLAALTATAILSFVGAAAASAATVRVASTRVVFTDHSRGTPASNGQPALTSRTLSTLLVYPKQASAPPHEFPLIVYSHGYGATAASALPTLKALASHGYVVAAPDFPLSTAGLPEGLDILDYSHQPGDVSFVISQMLLLDRTHSSPVFHRIQSHRIGVIGHSLGAVTTLAVSYNSCCRDPRIDAVVEMDGEQEIPIGPSGQFSGTYFRGHNAPLLVVNGSKDTIAPYAVSQAIYAQAPSPKYFLTLIGAPHEGFGTQPWFPVVNDTIAAFFGRYLGSGDSVGQIKRAGTKPGVTTLQLRAS